jgi:hypothetical protein
VRKEKIHEEKDHNMISYRGSECVIGIGTVSGNTGLHSKAINGRRTDLALWSRQTDRRSDGTQRDGPMETRRQETLTRMERMYCAGTQ